MKEYTIAYGTPPTDGWDIAHKANIDTYKWMDNGYEPRAYTQLMYDAGNIYVKHTAFEPEITVRHTSFQSDVYEDSCMEFFLMPADDTRYLNFETNAAGALLLHFGTSSERKPLHDINPDIFGFLPSFKPSEGYTGGKWTLEYKIPFSFLSSLYGGFDSKKGLYGNFYKCGDKTKFEHYGMWNVIENPTPQFHLPQFFGKIMFEA